MKHSVILVVLDGWGIGEKNESNPIHMANLSAFDFIEKNFRSGALQASGISVGLPWEEEGNSEVGHLTIGSGTVLYQHYPRITLAIRNESFFSNEKLKAAFDHGKKNNSTVHLIGLLGEGNVHSSFEHLKALIEMAKREKCRSLCLQLFTDGRDSPHRNASDLIPRLESFLKDAGVGEIVSLSGRYYAMDRDKHFERIEKTYSALIGKAPVEQTTKAALSKTYALNLSDEYVVPCIIKRAQPVKDSDAIIFFNFREDRMRELVEAFVSPNFSAFKTERFNNLFTVSFTEYDSKLSINVAFETPKVKTCLAKTIAEQGLSQLHIAETEKYAHVTYFFNGLREEPYENEFRILIPSRELTRHDEHPEMMASTITERVTASLKEGVFDFILVNYANPDIIAHTGNYEATQKAVQVIDEEIRKLVNVALEEDHTVLITSDHGNAEVLLDLKTGEAESKHNVSPVPIYLISRKYMRQIALNYSPKLEIIGFLSDVAPTILELMNLPKPPEMTGESRLSELATS